jgi:RHS repeat-associated protein
MSETETKLLSTTNSTEYGVPTTAETSKYLWLGSVQRSTETPTGIVAMGARSYVPQIGRFLQTDPVEGGSANAYSCTFGDPVNTADPSGESTGTPPPWPIEGTRETVEEDVARRAAEEAAARAEAERKIAEEEAASAAYWAYWNSYSANSEASFWAMWDEESAPSGGGSGGSGNPLGYEEDAGRYPPAFICNTRAKSKWGLFKKYCEKYKREEGSPWEPAEALCDIAAFTPFGAPCRVAIPIQSQARSTIRCLC